MQTEVVTDPDAIAAALNPFLRRLVRAGHGAGSLSPWLQPELGLPAVWLETKYVRAAMSAQRNKTGAADSLGLAHIVRTGLVPTGSYQDGELLSPTASADSASQPRAQGIGSREHNPHSLKAFGIHIKGTGRGRLRCGGASRSGRGSSN
jgi:hypothetical protein